MSVTSVNAAKIVRRQCLARTKLEAFFNIRLSRAVELSPHRAEHDRPILRGLLDRLHSRVRGVFRDRMIRLLEDCLRMVQFELRKLKTAADSGRSG